MESSEATSGAAAVFSRKSRRFMQRTIAEKVPSCEAAVKPNFSRDGDRGVADRTGVAGRFDIEMQFAGDMQLSPTSRPLPGEVGATELPTLDLALRQQLGLRLRTVRAPVEVLVIDHVERPSEN